MSYQSQIKTQAGKTNPGVLIFALSTCVWCRKTKALLGELGLEYRYLDVDLLEGSDQEEAVRELERLNPSGSFPTLVLKDRVIVGFQEAEIRKLAGE